MITALRVRISLRYVRITDGAYYQKSHIGDTLMDVVCTYKSLTTRKCKKLKNIGKLFQTSFYEHVIRDRNDYKEIV